MHKKIIYILAIIFFVTSCESMKSVKRGLTGEKVESTDEFLVKIKDPLVLPPDYENLPEPGNKLSVEEDIINFEETLGSSIEDNSLSSSSDSTENSILKKIRSK